MTAAVRSARRPRAEVVPAPPPRLYRFSVEQYHCLLAAGILNPNDRVELFDGWILTKMTHNPPHDATVSLAQGELLARLSKDWLVRIQSAITMPRSEPEPDVVVARGPARRYVRIHPRPRDIALVIEVADATLAYDRTSKGELYARSRIPVYWVINLVSARVEVYTEPRAGKAPAYRRRQDYGPGEAVPLVLAGQDFGSIPVRDLLP